MKRVPKVAYTLEFKLMRRIDELDLEHPFMGARMLRDQLKRQGLAVGVMSGPSCCAWASTLWRRSRAPAGGAGPQGLPVSAAQAAITRSNQVWALDTTY